MKQNIFIAISLNHVVIEIPRLFLVVKYKQINTRMILYYR